MLLEKLNGTVPCLLDTTTIPPEELSLKPSRSGADSGICEGPGAGGARHSNGEPSSSSGGHPYNRTFSPQFHHFVELCLQRDPEKRSAAFHAGFKMFMRTGFSLIPSCFFCRPSATTLSGHPFFKQVCKVFLCNYDIFNRIESRHGRRLWSSNINVDIRFSNNSF